MVYTHRNNLHLPYFWNPPAFSFMGIAIRHVVCSSEILWGEWKNNLLASSCNASLGKFSFAFYTGNCSCRMLCHFNIYWKKISPKEFFLFFFSGFSLLFNKSLRMALLHSPIWATRSFTEWKCIQRKHPWISIAICNHFIRNEYSF